MTTSTPAGTDQTPIEDYALLGDTRGSALVSSAGSIDWLAWPRFDSAATFVRLLDTDRGGSCSVHAPGLTTTGREYVDGTNILTTHFSTPTGAFDIVDLMTIHPLADVPATGADNDAPGRLVRLVRCTAGQVDVQVDVHPTFDFARAPAAVVSIDGTTAVLAGGQHTMWATTSGHWEARVGRAVATLHLELRQEGFVVLGSGAPPAAATDAGTARSDHDATRRYWTSWSSRCDYDGEHRDAVLRSSLTLKAMIYAPTGAIVAAATAGLPEAVGGDRNYDYRFTWLRDAAFTIGAFLDVGFEREGQEFLRFLSDADTSEGRDLQIFYPVDGGPVDDPQEVDLAGYRGSRPVTIGNDAGDQAQHEVFSEVLCALHNVWHTTGDKPLAGRGGDRMQVVVRNVVEQVLATWAEPDRSIWENRDGDQHFLHSKAMSWVAMDRAVQLARMLDMPEETTWRHEADTIRADYEAKGWNAGLGAYTQAYGSDVMDAAVLRTVLFGALPADDDRMAGTLDALHRDLVEADLVFRYRVADGGQGTEGAFVVCAFWLVEVLALAGRLDDAKDLLTRALSRTNDVGLLSEEIDPRTGAFLGNHPQAFSHIGVVNAAVRLRNLDRGD